MRLKVSNVCQLLDKSKYPATQTKQGVTYTNDGNGIITLNGTNTASYLCVFILNVIKGKPGHKYMQLGATDDGWWNTYGLECKWIDGDGVGHGFTMTNGIMSIPSDVIVRDIFVSALVYQGYTVSNKTFKPQLFDLTEMYGAGNEPTTVEQFRQDFPNEMYEYSPVCWKKFRRLKYVTETKNLFDINKLTAYTPETLPNGTAGVYNGVIISKGRIDDTTCSTGKTLRQLCPDLIVGETYTLNFETTVPSSVGGQYESIHLRGSSNWWRRNRKVITESDLSAVVYIYAETDGAVYMTYNLQIEKGSTASPYQPYGYLPLNRGKYIANKEPVQLLDKSKYPATITNNGITFTNNGDGTITLNGTNAGGGANLYTFMKVSVKARHYYYIYSGQAGTWGTCMFTVDKSISADKIDGHIGFQGAHSFDNVTAYLFIGAGATFNNYVVKPQFFDLTEMYGAGNEPTTVAQFRADYPNELYDYNPYNAITFR